MKKLILSGKIWVLLDREGKLIENIDTDQIYHNAFLHITDISKMGQYALGNLEGWKDFPQKANSGDIIITGRNFGAGSSRQQAVDCFISLNIGLIIAPSFGAIYFRNAVNCGFPVLRCPDVADLVECRKLKAQDEIRIDLKKGEGHNLTQNITFGFQPLSSVQYDIYIAGGLFSYAKSQKKG